MLPIYPRDLKKVLHGTWISLTPVIRTNNVNEHILHLTILFQCLSNHGRQSISINLNSIEEELRSSSTRSFDKIVRLESTTEILVNQISGIIFKKEFMDK